MSRSVKIESTRCLLDDVFRVEEVMLRHELPGGASSDPVRLLNFERGDSVAALVIHRDRRTCVLAEQFRYPAYTRGEGWLSEIPAGIVEAGETPEDAIRREILEEIGYRVGSLTPVADFFPSPGACSERITIFCAIVGDSDRVTAGGGTDDEERIDVVEVSLEAIEARLSRGLITDGKTLIAMNWMLLRLARGELLPESNHG